MTTRAEQIGYFMGDTPPRRRRCRDYDGSPCFYCGVPVRYSAADTVYLHMLDDRAVSPFRFGGYRCVIPPWGFAEPRALVRYANRRDAVVRRQLAQGRRKPGEDGVYWPADLQAASAVQEAAREYWRGSLTSYLTPAE